MDSSWLEASGPALELAQEFGRLARFERHLRTRVVRWDVQMHRLFGIDPAQPVPDAQAVIEHVHPDDRARLRAEYDAAIRRAGRYATRFRVLRADATQREVQALVEVRDGGDGLPELMLGVVIDDTEGAARARAQEELNAKLAEALKLAQIAVWHIDPVTNRLYHNDASRHLAGMPDWPQYVDLDVVRAATHPDDLALAVRAASEALARPGAVDAETRYLDASGHYRDILTRCVAERDASGKVIGLMGVSLDQTERVAERKRAQALVQRIDLVADAAGVGIWSVDVESGQVEWNAQMFRIYGRDPGEPAPNLRQWVGSWVHPDDRRALAAQRRRSIESNESGFETEFRIVRPDATVRQVACRSRRELREGRAFHVGIHLDVTEQARQRASAEQALRDKLTAERASQAKTEFLARISHELRTPLNAVLGFAQLMEHDGANPLAPLQLERVAHIRSAGEHLMALIGDVLDLSATEDGSLQVSLEPVDIDALLADVMQWVAAPAQHARVSLHLERHGGRVQADPRRLRQVLSNLLSNAVKYNRAGGDVWLSAHSASRDGRPFWALSVRDNGRGLNRSQRAHLFESFNRLGVEHEGIEGMGIGLTIVRQLTELMGGRVEVHSEAGRGSEFVVWLPAADVQAPAGDDLFAEAAGLASAPATPEVPPLTILYIEDNPVNVILVRELVAMRPGVALECAVDGLSGVARALADPPDVVLIDMQLPDIDGYEVLRRLRAAPGLAGRPMIALSANGMPEDIAQAEANGFDAYWTKPIDFCRFLADLDTLAVAAQRRASLQPD